MNKQHGIGQGRGPSRSGYFGSAWSSSYCKKWVQRDCGEQKAPTPTPFTQSDLFSIYRDHESTQGALRCQRCQQRRRAAQAPPCPLPYTSASPPTHTNTYLLEETQMLHPLATQRWRHHQHHRSGLKGRASAPPNLLNLDLRFNKIPDDLCALRCAAQGHRDSKSPKNLHTFILETTLHLTCANRTWPPKTLNK